MSIGWLGAGRFGLIVLFGLVVLFGLGGLGCDIDQTERPDGRVAVDTGVTQADGKDADGGRDRVSGTDGGGVPSSADVVDEDAPDLDAPADEADEADGADGVDASDGPDLQADAFDPMSFHCPNGCPAGEECYYIPHVHIAACVHCGGPDEYCCGGSNGPRCTYGVCQFVGGNGLPRCLPPGSGLPPL